MVVVGADDDRLFAGAVDPSDHVRSGDALDLGLARERDARDVAFAQTLEKRSTDADARSARTGSAALARRRSRRRQLEQWFTRLVGTGGHDQREAGPVR